MSSDKRPNGCGPGLLGDLDVLDGPDGVFENPCNRHDDDYAAGGREMDRWRADWNLFVAMLRVSRARLRIPKRWLGYALASIYLVKTLMWGWTRFCYRKQSLPP